VFLLLEEVAIGDRHAQHRQLQAAEQGVVKPGTRVVCTVTGNGLKDPDWAISGAPAPTVVRVDAHEAASALGLT